MGKKKRRVGRPCNRLPKPRTADERRGATIRKFREAAEKSQAQCAEEIGVHPDAWRRWETGTYRVPSGRLTAIAAAVGCEVGELL